MVETLNELPAQLHISRERVSDFDRPGSISDVIREYEVRVGLLQSEEIDDAVALNRTARLMARLAVLLAIGGLAAGALAALSLDNRISVLAPDVGLAILGCSIALISTVGVWSRDRLGRHYR
jgi:hypothetical protein